MSLIAHYRLDGNVNDAFGRSNGTASGALVFEDGKLGKCINLKTSGNVTFPTSIKHTYSVSFWYKRLSSPDGVHRKIFTKGADRSPGFWTGTSDFLHLRQSLVNGGNVGADITGVGTGVWRHIVFTCEQTAAGVRINSYMDGVKSASSGFYAGDSVNITGDPNSFVLNRDSVVGHSLDDIRIYDHALSEREVKDLSKGLLLRYDFDQFQEPTENILSVAGYESESVKSGASYPFTSHNITTVVQSRWSALNNKISLQMESRNDVGNGYACMYVYFSDWSWSINFGTNDTSWALRKKENIEMPDPTGKTVMFAVYHMPSGSTGTSYARKLQVEFKAHCTPYVNGTRAGIVRDSSSQGHDAPLELTKTPRWIEGGSVGKGCYLFDGSGTTDGTITGNYISVNPDITDTRKYPDGVTYSFWLNIDEDSVNRQSLFFGQSTLLHIEINSTSRNFRTEAASNGYSFGSSTFPNPVRGRWSHFAIAFATGEPNRPVRWYQDGVLFSTNNLGTDYFWFGEIGRSTGTTAYTYANSLKGKLDDLRIYATALSADEVMELYRQRASIDSQGNLVC